jgi:uncharacterized radical SAM superfamily Fe-S cluster-containing enzyme
MVMSAAEAEAYLSALHVPTITSGPWKLMPDGPGTFLARDIAEFFQGRAPGVCGGCADWVRTMNEWGPAGCREPEHFAEIVDRLVGQINDHEWETKVPWKIIAARIALKLPGGAIPVRAVCEHMILRSIEQAEQAQAEAERAADNAVASLDTERQPATFVYPYLASQAVGLELLYSVRSVERFYQGETDIWIVGDRPDWWLRDDRFVHCPRVKGGARVDRAHKLEVICQTPDIPDQFVWMQDDIYFVKPVTFGFLATAWTRSPVRASATPKPTCKRCRGFSKQKYRTLEALAANGKTLDDYAAHVPVVYQKEKLRVMFAKYPVAGKELVDDLLYQNEYATPDKPAVFIGARMARIERTLTDKQLQDRLRPAVYHNHLHGKYRGPVERNLERTFSQPCKWEDTRVHIVTTEMRAAAESTIRPLGFERLPKIAVCCATYGRPNIINTLVGCFARQEYPSDRCEMVILDDGGQLAPGTYRFGGKEIRVHTQTERFPTLGAKRNALRQLVSHDVDAMTQWDDDDIFLPWALQAMAECLQRVGIAFGTWSYWKEKPGDISVVRKMFHGNCCFQLATFDAIGGYPEKNRGEDMAFLANWVPDRGRGKVPKERNTMDRFQRYMLVRRRLPGTYHATNADLDYAALPKEPGENVVIQAGAFPSHLQTWYDTIVRDGLCGKKRVPDSEKGLHTNLNVVEWHLTYECNLACVGCNRLCFLPPRTEPMTLGDAEEFCKQARELNWHPTIMVLGGEPTLHPDVIRFVELAHELSPGKVRFWSNGCAPRAKEVLCELEQRGICEIVKFTHKPKGSVVHKYADMYLAPIDFGLDSRDPCRCHASFGSCGCSVDHEGYTLCPCGGAIDAFLKLGIRTKRLADLFDREFAKRQTRAMCRVCGFRCGIDGERIAKSSVIHGALMSPTWQEAVSRLPVASQPTPAPQPSR